MFTALMEFLNYQNIIWNQSSGQRVILYVVLVNRTEKQLLIILKIRELKNKIKNNNVFKNNSTPTI